LTAALSAVALSAVALSVSFCLPLCPLKGQTHLIEKNYFENLFIETFEAKQAQFKASPTHRNLRLG